MDKRKLTIEDPDLGERTFEMTPLNLIRDQHRLLMHYKNTRDNPTLHLLQDIAVYEYIIDAPNAEELARDYLLEAEKQRAVKGIFSVIKMEVAKALGWKVQVVQ